MEEEQAHNNICDTVKKGLGNNLTAKIKVQKLDAEKLKTQNHIFKVEFQKTDVTMKVNNKTENIPLTNAFLKIAQKPEFTKKFGDHAQANRMMPKYIQEHKKKLDHICKLLRDTDHQTKNPFNAKTNSMQPKFRKKGTKEWTNLDATTVGFLDSNIREIFNKIETNYVVDEKEFLDSLKPKNSTN